MFSLPCVIFAGGKSSRMGKDKALLPFASYSTLAEYQYSRVSKLFTQVYIVTKNSSKFPFQANFIEDDKSIEVYAPTAGFLTMFHQLKENRFFVLSVDAPFIDEKIITTLLAADKSDCDATIAMTEDGIEPLCGIYHRSMEKKFQQMLQEKNYKLGLLLQNAHTNFVSFKDKKPFFNCNYPHEYQEALTQLINPSLL